MLLHLLPWVKVEDAIHKFNDFYLYAGFDCTNKWANFLGDVPRRQTMVTRLQDALGVTEEEIQYCRDKITSKQWSLVDVAKAVEDCLLGENSGKPCSLMDRVCTQPPKACPDDAEGETNPVRLNLLTGLVPAWT